MVESALDASPSPRIPESVIMSYRNVRRFGSAILGLSIISSPGTAGNGCVPVAASYCIMRVTRHVGHCVVRSISNIDAHFVKLFKPESGIVRHVCVEDRIPPR
jgi:hypothetical protein